MARGPERPARRTDDVFGDDLPQASSDERDPGAGEREPDRDEWLRDNVPPHHG